MGGEGGGGWDGLEPVKHCVSWQGRCGGGGEGGVDGVGGEGGEGGRGWAWTGARKTLLFVAEAVGAVRAVRAVWAVRVGHGLEPVKHCFSWQGRCGVGGEGGVGGVGGVGGEGGESGEGGGGWAWTGACKTLLFMAGAGVRACGR